MISRPIVSLLLCPALVLAVSAGLSDDGPLFSVRFSQKSITFTGKVDSTETTEALSAVVQSARPDLKISTEGLVVDPASPFPQLGDVKSLLAEIGLSTHEGVLEMWPDRIVIGGLTDSPVTQTALKIRVDPLLKNRSLINRVCIVGSDELPKIDISLASGKPGALAAEAVPPPTVGPAFEVPGILLEKLFPAIVMLNSFDRLEGKAGNPGDPVRAMPLLTDAEAGMPEGSGTPAASAPATPMLMATPVQEYELLPSVRFSRNASILQSNQTTILDELAKRLLSPERIGAPVFIEGVIPAGGSAALNDYLAERRSAEVVRLLQERGLDPKLLLTGVIRSPSPADEGEVRLRVEILLPAAAPEPPATAGTIGVETGTSPAAPASAAANSGQNPAEP